MSILSSAVLSHVAKPKHICMVDPLIFYISVSITMVMIVFADMLVTGLFLSLVVLSFFAWKRYKNPHYLSEIVAYRKLVDQQKSTFFKVRRSHNEYIS